MSAKPLWFWLLYRANKAFHPKILHTGLFSDDHFQIYIFFKFEKRPLEICICDIIKSYTVTPEGTLRSH